MAINYSNKNIVKGFQKKPKPVDDKKANDIEQECLEEIKEVQEYAAKARAGRDRFKENTDANYFTVITFNNSKQLDEFFNKLGITPSDKQYINGKALAKKLGIEIETPDKIAPGSFRISSKLTDLTM